MNGSLKIVQALVLLSLAGLFFTSCGGNQTTLASTTTSGTTTGGNTGQTSGTPTLEEEEKNATIPAGYSASNLFVAVPDSLNFLNFSSVESSWADRCTFTSGTPTNDLTCAVEVGELDLFYNGIKLQFNTPANQCKYIKTEPYWYYNHETGFGPSEVIVNVTKNASGAVMSANCTVDGVAFGCASAPPAVANDITIDYTGDEIKVRCAYDTSNVIGGVNCCFGKYDLHTVLSKSGQEPIVKDEFANDWGGGSNTCIGGAGRTDWENYDFQGLPIPLIERNTAGVPRTKIIKTTGPLFSSGMSTNIPVANYFTPALHTHTGFGSASGATTSSVPYYVDPISDRSGDLLQSGNEFYTFECLDEAFESNYRIRVLVQDWNTVAALQTYIGNGNIVPGPDVSGTAPASCPGIAGKSCNQAQDADDFVNSLPGGFYNNALPANRARFFPKHSYQ